MVSALKETCTLVKEIEIQQVNGRNDGKDKNRVLYKYKEGILL